MSQTVKKTITVQELTRYGVKVNNTYVNWSKNINPEHKAKVVPGGSYEAEVFIADSGKEYINSIISQTGMAALSQVEKAVKASSPSPKASEGMSKEEWHLKDVRISRQGLWQAAIQAIAPLVSLDILAEETAKLADKGLEYVNSLPKKGE